MSLGSDSWSRAMLSKHFLKGSDSKYFRIWGQRAKMRMLYTYIITTTTPEKNQH